MNNSSLHRKRVALASKIAEHTLQLSIPSLMYQHVKSALLSAEHTVKRCLQPFYESNDIEDVIVEYDAVRNSLTVRIVPTNNVQFKFEIK